MALAKCPECGKDVSSKAPACPHCGIPFRSAAKPASSGTGIGCGGFIVICFVLSIVAGQISTKRSQEDQAAQQHAESLRRAKLSPEQKAAEDKRKADEKAKAEEQKLLSNARTACKEFVKKRLRDPDSAEFEQRYAAEKTGPDTFHAQVHGRAKNGFGGYNLSTWDCQLSLTGGNWLLLSLKEIN